MKRFIYTAVVLFCATIAQ
ncbi:unnamed protein product, partial [Allacma fusca]